jgi:hypothetical protein
MVVETSEDTSEINKFILKNGLQQLVDSYKPAWFYFHSLFGVVYGQLIPSRFQKGTHINFKRSYLINDGDDGKLVVDVMRKAENF